MGLLNPNINIKDIYKDICRIDRAKAKARRNAHQMHDEKVEDLCIGVDVRTETNVQGNSERKWRESSGKRRGGPERHLTVTKEMPYEREYLTYRILPNISATGDVLQVN